MDVRKGKIIRILQLSETTLSEQRQWKFEVSIVDIKYERTLKEVLNKIVFDVTCRASNIAVSDIGRYIHERMTSPDEHPRLRPITNLKVTVTDFMVYRIIHLVSQLLDSNLDSFDEAYEVNIENESETGQEEVNQFVEYFNSIRDESGGIPQKHRWVPDEDS